MLRRLLPGPDRGEGRLRFAARLLVAVLCGAALLQAMRPAVYSVRQGVQVARGAAADSSARQFREQLEYLGAELHRQVPAGTRARIVEVDPQWVPRVVELATQQGIVVVGAGAQVEVRLDFDPAAPHGVRLVTRAVDG